MISVRDHNFCLTLMRRFFAPPPSDLPDEWAEKNWVFNEKEIKGKFDFTGRHYTRRPMRDSVNPNVRKMTLVWARGTSKTSVIQIRLGYGIKYLPGSGIMILPATNRAGGSRAFVKNRFIPNIKATADLAALIPPGQERFCMNMESVSVNGAHIAFVGSKSAGQVVGPRNSLIVMDEKEKYPKTIGDEAGTSELVAGSVEGVAEYLIINTSTPSVESGLIWQDLLQSNFMLNFVPCPHCNGGEHGKTEEERQLQAVADGFRGWFTYAWSEQFAAGLPTKFAQTQPVAGHDLKGKPIPMAFVKWGKIVDGKNDCKRRDGSWDLEHVMRDSYFECPHCKGQIRDITVDETRKIKLVPHRKVWMDENSFWMPTQDGEPKHMGYQFGNLGAPVINEESTVGGRAVKFLSACEEGGEAVRNFINAMLGLVEVGQAHDSGRIEIANRPFSQPDWIALLTADFHKNAPYIWFTVRKWCAFKLAAPVTITDGKPDFVSELDSPENFAARDVCAMLINPKIEPDQITKYNSPIWNIIGELARFNSNDPATGRSPLVDFLIAQKICGDRLINFFKETAGGDTMEFRKQILLAMWKLSGGDEKNFRASRGGDSELIAAGNIDAADCWAELKAIEQEFNVGVGLPPKSRAVFIDCGYQDKYDPEVLRECYERAEHFKWWLVDSPKHAPVTYGWWQKGESTPPTLQGRISLPCAADGWLPLQGVPTFQPQGDGRLSRELSMRTADPFYGTGQNEGTRVIEVLRVPQMLFWKRRQDLRDRRTKNTWSISPNVSWWPKHYSVNGDRLNESNYTIEDYLRQSDGQYYDEKTKKVEPKAGRGGAQSKRNPYHVDDCEIYQVAGATLNEFFAT